MSFSQSLFKGSLRDNLKNPYFYVPAGLIALTGTLFLVRNTKFFTMARLATSLFKDGLKNRLTGVGREERALRYVIEHAQQGNPESVLRALDYFGNNEQLLINVGKDKGQFISDAIATSNAKNALELGAYCGYSAVLIASNLRKKHGDSARLISIELNPLYAAIATKVVEHAGLASNVKIIIGASDKKLKVLKSEYGVTTFDFVFIDHWKNVYLRDIKLIEQESLLHDGSIVAADNVIFPGAPDYLQYIRNNKNYRSILREARLFANLVDGVEISTYTRVI
jgi:catechol O-methyltransferase